MAQAIFGHLRSITIPQHISIMAPMKAIKAGGKAMTKGALADAVATKCELKKSVAAKVINELADIATSEVKKAGVFTVPGLCRIKTRMKPATKAGKREMFGKITVVKAKPAKKIVKAFPSVRSKSTTLCRPR